MPQVKCKQCGSDFYAKPCSLKRGWGIYCSSKCQYEGSRKGIFVKCEICGTEIWRKPRQLGHSKSQKYFCTKSHQTLWRNQLFSGSEHWNWKNGENIAHKAFLIKNKIKPVCKLCACVDIRILAVHHLDKDHKNNVLENLVFLCHNCHHLVHCYKVKVPNP
jgi:5-methylcytosine-specific restriction endonuclease McrA